jgi:hypothetical protein
MARGLPQGCVREVRVIAANHATARDNAGTRNAQGRVGGACTPGIADYSRKARSTGPSHFPQRISFRRDVTGLASIFPSGLVLRALRSQPVFALSLDLHRIFDSRASNFSSASIASVLIRSYQKNKNKIL